MNHMKNGGPAFPAIIPFEHSDVQGKDYPDYGESGMTLRDYFAAQALTLGGEFFHNIDGALFGSNPAERCARIAYAIADAMIKERDKQST